jgi:hypothetical protein
MSIYIQGHYLQLWSEQNHSIDFSTRLILMPIAIRHCKIATHMMLARTGHLVSVLNLGFRVVGRFVILFSPPWWFTVYFFYVRIVRFPRNIFDLGTFCLRHCVNECYETEREKKCFCCPTLSFYHSNYLSVQNVCVTYLCHKWPRICSVCRNQNLILSLFKTYITGTELHKPQLHLSLN